MVWDHEVGGSNPLTPTSESDSILKGMEQSVTVSCRLVKVAAIGLGHIVRIACYRLGVRLQRQLRERTEK